MKHANEAERRRAEPSYGDQQPCDGAARHWPAEKKGHNEKPDARQRRARRSKSKVGRETEADRDQREARSPKRHHGHKAKHSAKCHRF
ncbi:hypothetical protein D9M72_332050 [compost metagenome]